MYDSCGLNQGSANFFSKGPDGNILGLAGHKLSDTVTDGCACGVNTVIDQTVCELMSMAVC